MRVLFVFSGNNPLRKVAPFIESQAISIRDKGHDLHFCIIKGKGIRGYLSNIPKIRRHVEAHKIDVIHAHYSLSAMSCVLAMTRKPLVVSLNGSDVNGTQSHSIFKNFKAPIVILISMIIQFCADFIICKSPQIHRRIHKTNSAVIPNGVDLNRYKEVSYDSEHSSDSFKILFLGNPKDTNKNIQLLIDAVDLIGDERIKVIAPYRVPNQEIPNYLASANMLAHCSFKEGSSNVIKEAMACNLPIVATDAGDSWWLLGDLDGHYKTDFDPQSYASCIREIMKNRKATRGRERLIELGLESSTVAQKIISIYLNALRGHNPRSPEI